MSRCVVRGGAESELACGVAREWVLVVAVVATRGPAEALSRGWQSPQMSIAHKLALSILLPWMLA